MHASLFKSINAAWHAGWAVQITRDSLAERDRRAGEPVIYNRIATTPPSPRFTHPPPEFIAR